MSRRTSTICGLIVFASFCHAALADRNFAFVSVALDTDTTQADVKLARYLTDKTGIQLDPQQVEYEEAIRRLVSWKEGDRPFLARMTPYACVAAEMLGASFDVLASYNSKATGSDTYHAYFVVRRTDFGAQAPRLGDLIDYLRSRARAGSPARFAYHDRFSTSSYFLPSLFFRQQRIFAAGEGSTGYIPIGVNKLSGSSSVLIDAVIDPAAADFAAVWDGTRQKAEASGKGAQLYFIPLPDAIPNDLLVYSRGISGDLEDRLHGAIKSMSRTDPGEIGTGDFRWWDEFKQADEARMALANLRRLAAEHLAPVTVFIETESDRHGAAVPAEVVEAARQAVRLSGSEFVMFDEDFYVHKDVTWILKLVHEGAITLTAEINGSPQKQVFRLSFTDATDLTKRIGELIHSRMNRIRYVWPYDLKTPTVIRDVDFSIPAGTMLEARRITWLDPERNSFREGAPFQAAVTASDFFKFSLEPQQFPSATSVGPGWAYEPISSDVYRVILVRPSVETGLFRLLTGIFVVLLVGAAAACTWDLSRRRKRPVPSPLDKSVAAG